MKSFEEREVVGVVTEKRIPINCTVVVEEKKEP